MTARLDHRTLYRLPWSLPDNAISWLEPTAACNLYCEGCYRTNDPRSHKTLSEIEADLDVFTSLRTCDGISVAGGDPLTHPDVAQIVAMIAQRGLKPILNTNGLALSRELLVELKRAGLKGLTLHIDSKQRRRGWNGKSEVELNALRLQFAEMIAEVGDLSCAFNSTVYDDTLESVPDIVAWAQEHIDIVHVVVFIAFRSAMLGGPFDYYVGGERVELGEVPYATPASARTDIQSTDILATIQERFPDFAPCAYLNGTERPDSFKWLLAGRLGAPGRPGRIDGYVGPRFMELAQTTHHFRHGRYLAYSGPRVLRRGRSLLLLSPVDHGLRSAAASYLRAAARNPLNALKRIHFQSVMIIQPIDVLPDGRQNMCDGCPDMTVWNGRLAWSCRLEEPQRYGAFVQTVPKKPPTTH
ncbi:MAG: radical SAM protein [Gemmatimonadetes bacterium]|uniref:Radical SAM protein n=1 Tax=Candidatus Kutchimonas denitrificans TaxID=3056748 RepID=A0AAE4Z4P5_9BACT|nr:radical SAM protein [Gemmatimonadota bacterium]NIR73700.1 radical SAM protein [Candidatus Kutchimonas denitrificans]NIS00750.1 radical SAM protein [Gemmatimonadota bacterium]NIT66337.1 radical SAM protein [Gemmatimonadota bacterium]NIU51555.1 radical SAM protein [Gemmatimonadota bacterium]